MNYGNMPGKRIVKPEPIKQSVKDESFKNEEDEVLVISEQQYIQEKVPTPMVPKKSLLIQRYSNEKD